MVSYTKQAQEVLKTAKRTAQQLKHNYVGTEHLLIGLRREYTSVAGQILAECGVEEEKLIQTIDKLIEPDRPVASAERDGFTPRLEAILEDSRMFADAYGNSECGTEHMLLAIIRDSDCVAAKILVTLNISLQNIYMMIVQILGEDLDDVLNSKGKQQGNAHLLEQYSTDLTKMAADGKLDPVIGRETEISRMIQILSRRTKNNPCLIGEPGVGKSAVVDGLAIEIAGGDVPPQIADKRLLTMDLSGMVAGSKYRGEFEERMKGIIHEVQQEGNVLLFLDEVHTLIGAGGAEGALDAANILKPALARGEFQLIGATTISEYRKYIEKDAALERRFQPVTIEEPSEEMTVRILKGLRPRYESFHGVTITDGAVMSAVKLSERYITDRHLPDKAIDVMDETCSKVRLHGFRPDAALQGLEKKRAKLEISREEALKTGTFEEATALNNEYHDVVRKIERKHSRLQKNTAGKRVSVGENDVAGVVSEWTRIPVQRLTEAEGERLMRLEATLHKRVIGQDEAVSAVARAVKRGRVGFKDPGRPIGSFLFLGPTGVGKTELSKALAEALFQTEESMIRVDMSEYMEKQSVAKLIGSPPGYVGYEEGGQLSEKVRRHPYSVILFDEIEKAHPDVFNTLLQVLDDGHITDSQGRTVDFKNTVIIMTSNAGAKAIVDSRTLGFAAAGSEAQDYKSMKSSVMEEVKRIFKPEFLNRIDEIIVFHSLTAEDLGRIASLMLGRVAKRTEEQMNIRLKFRPSVRDYIVKKGTDRKFGARPLRRAIQNEIEDVLADAVLSGTIHEGESAELGMRGGKLCFYHPGQKSRSKTIQ